MDPELPEVEVEEPPVPAEARLRCLEFGNRLPRANRPFDLSSCPRWSIFCLGSKELAFVFSCFNEGK